jgi:hypothetical protein
MPTKTIPVEIGLHGDQVGNNEKARQETSK